MPEGFYGWHWLQGKYGLLDGIPRVLGGARGIIGFVLDVGLV